MLQPSDHLHQEETEKKHKFGELLCMKNTQLCTLKQHTEKTPQVFHLAAHEKTAFKAPNAALQQDKELLPR